MLNRVADGNPLFSPSSQRDARLRFGGPGHRLPSADSADRSAAALHQTPEERQQPDEGLHAVL